MGIAPNVDDTIEYEIHFAAEPCAASADLKRELATLGFEADALDYPGATFPEALGMNSCPILDTHVTWSAFSRDEYLVKKVEFEALLERFAPVVSGYAHAEVIRPEWDVEFSWLPYDDSQSIEIAPLRFETGSRQKVWDIHISARLETLSPALMTMLHETLNMYYIDLRKARGVYRIFTAQGADDAADARLFFDHLVQRLRRMGGFEGSAKLEQTIFWRILGDTALTPPHLAGSPMLYILPTGLATISDKAA